LKLHFKRIVDTICVSFKKLAAVYVFLKSIKLTL